MLHGLHESYENKQVLLKHRQFRVVDGLCADTHIYTCYHGYKKTKTYYQIHIMHEHLQSNTDMLQLRQKFLITCFTYLLTQN